MSDAPKVWDETWRAEEDGIGAWDIVDDGDGINLARSPVRIGFTSIDDEGYDGARARLAAAAPEMVRLLLELQYAEEDDGVPRCPECGGWDPSYVASGSVLRFGHSEDCRLVAVLRKAGVLPTP